MHEERPVPDYLHVKRSWIEIDLNALRKNLEIYKSRQSSPREIMAVVKANAYGHGDCAVSRFLTRCGVRFFAVACIEEAVRLREHGIDGEILVLGYSPVGRAADLIRYDITQALLCEDYARLLAETGLPVKCQFAVDTGMRRIGVNADEPEQCERVIREFAGMLRLNGIFTHLCAADTPEQDAFTRRQIARFEEIAARVSDLKLAYLHCLNSAGGLWHDAPACNIDRLGIVLYGLKPDYANRLPEGIGAVLSWKSVVSMIKPVKTGDTIGYGRSFSAQRPMTVATISTGYADGYPRSLSNKGYVLIRGQRAPIVGRVCMDQMMVDITDIRGVRFGDEAVLIGKSGDEEISADEMGRQAGTIGYEVICGIAERVERIYVE